MYLVTVGTKAQLVKMAPVLLAMRSEGVPFRFILTGQHRETMQDLIRGFGLPAPDTTLVESGESDTPTGLISWFFTSFRRMLSWYRDQSRLTDSAAGVVVHGDTVSTLWGALFGKLKRIPVHHVEAGLRSFNLFRPFPEELVRILVTWLSDVCYAPGEFAVENLAGKSVVVIDTKQNTLLDSLRMAIAANPEVDDGQPGYLVASIHRTENILDKRALLHIVGMMTEIARMGRVKFVLHPVTRTYLQGSDLVSTLVDGGVELVDRMDYFSFIRLLLNSRGLITDGGSNQEESSYMGLPCLLMRKETERTEGLDSNVMIAAHSREKVQRFAESCFAERWQQRPLPEASPSAIIARHLKQSLR